MSVDPALEVFVVIPALNEAKSIAAVIGRVGSVASVLVVDDGSTDETAAVSVKAGAEVVRNETNGGYEAALNLGFEQARRKGAQVVVTVDADGELPAELIGDLASPIQAGQADIVIGQRPQSARWAELLFSIYTKVRYGVTDICCGMKAYNMDFYDRHGCFDSVRSVGTELAIFSLLNGARVKMFPLPDRPKRQDAPRYGVGWRPNLRILRAMALAVWAEFGRGYATRRRSAA